MSSLKKSLIVLVVLALSIVGGMYINNDNEQVELITTIEDIIVAEPDIDVPSHYWHIDKESVKTIYKLSKGRRITSYINHTNAGGRFTTEVGYFYNFEIKKDGTLVADFKFFDHFIKYYTVQYLKILELVHHIPEEIGVSGVYQADVILIDIHGTVYTEKDLKQLPEEIGRRIKWKHKFPVVRFTKVVAIDWVSKGALTPSGLLYEIKEMRNNKLGNLTLEELLLIEIPAEFDTPQK